MDRQDLWPDRIDEWRKVCAVVFGRTGFILISNSKGAGSYSLLKDGR